MKTRIIDKYTTPKSQKPDATWEAFANQLQTALGDNMTKDDTPSPHMAISYCHQRMREFDERMLDSLVYNVPPAFTEDTELFGDTAEEVAETYFSNVHWAASQDAPFLLLGHVGVGKTTFLLHYFYNVLRRKNRKILPLILNFKTAIDIGDKFIHGMLERLNSRLNAEEPALRDVTRPMLEALFADEVAAIKATLASRAAQSKQIDKIFARFTSFEALSDWEALRVLVARKIQYFRKKGRVPWIIIDNVDQHHHTLHHDVFTNALAIASGFKCSLIIVMRLITLDTPAARSTYDSYRPRCLRLSMPDLKAVIDGRLKLFDQLSKDLLDAPLVWTGNRETVRSLAEDIKKATAMIKEHDVLVKCLLPLSNYSVRRFLDIISSAYQSYYFYFDRFNQERYAPNPKILGKRLLYAHLLKNRDYYDPNPLNDKEFFVLNLFENEDRGATGNQLIRIRLLQCLMSFGNSVAPISQCVNRLLDVFSYDRISLLSALRAFLRVEMIEVDPILWTTKRRN